MGGLEGAIREAAHFILSHKDKEGLWRDFKSRTHGESIDWVTCYVALSLLNSGIPYSKLQMTAISISKRQNKNGGWGYNERIVPDADSTAFAIMFLSKFGYEEQVSQAKKFLLRHQNEDGGFSTYLPDLIREYRRISEDMPVNGWCGGINDVTATSLQALEEDDKALDYLIKNQQKDGSWRAYWWTSDIYSTAQAVFAIRDYSKEEGRKAQRWLSHQHMNNEAPFYIALALRGLIIDDEHRKDADLLVKILLDSQEEDGSWPSYPILRFPLPSNTEPWKDETRWRENSQDQNRIFTTAACLRALSQYEHNI